MKAKFKKAEPVAESETKEQIEKTAYDRADKSKEAPENLENPEEKSEALMGFQKAFKERITEFSGDNIEKKVNALANSGNPDEVGEKHEGESLIKTAEELERIRLELDKAAESERQPFERFPELAESILHAANHWQTDSTWTKHLELTNKICLMIPIIKDK